MGNGAKNPICEFFDDGRDGVWSDIVSGVLFWCFGWKGVGGAGKECS